MKEKKKLKRHSPQSYPGSFDDCSCSCDTLDNLNRRQKQLEAELRPGAEAPLNEIMSMSRCFQQCMGEFMGCQQ